LASAGQPFSSETIGFSYAADLISLNALFFPMTPSASGIVVSPPAKASPGRLALIFVQSASKEEANSGAQHDASSGDEYDFGNNKRPFSHCSTHLDRRNST
jgi:hypothetical protein